MKKIYITDLDHTFLRTDLSLSDYTKNIWNSYASEAILSVATARTYKKTVQFLEGVEINAPMILLDGALIASRDGEIVETKTIPEFLGNQLVGIGAELGIFPFIIAQEGERLQEIFLHAEQLNYAQKEVLKRYAKDDNLVAKSHLNAIERNYKFVFMGEEQRIRYIAEEIKERFGDSLQYILAPEAYVGCYFLTILHKDADKSHGIKSVSEYMGFDTQNLTVFGDNFNDLGMFALAGNAVAVANAQEGVKAKADVVLGHSNDEDGVAHYLEELRR